MARKKYKDPVPDRPRNISPHIPLVNALIKEADVKYKGMHRFAESYKHGIIVAHNEYIAGTDITPFDVADVYFNLDIDEAKMAEGKAAFNEAIKTAD